jgi:hypothetical protein
MALNDLIHVTANLVTDGNEILMCRIINCLSNIRANFHLPPEKHQPRTPMDFTRQWGSSAA